MNAPPHHVSPHRLVDVLASPYVRVALLTSAALLVEVVLARNVLDVQLNFFVLLAPLWVLVAYKVSGRRGRTSEMVASVAVVGVTAAVLLAYAF